MVGELGPKFGSVGLRQIKVRVERPKELLRLEIKPVGIRRRYSSICRTLKPRVQQAPYRHTHEECDQKSHRPASPPTVRATLRANELHWASCSARSAPPALVMR